MNINISVRQDNVSEAAKSYAQEKVLKLDKYKLQRAEVIMEGEGDAYKVEIMALPYRGSKYVASTQAEEWFAAIDQTVDKVERQLRKAKEKQVDHHRKKRKTEPRGMQMGDDYQGIGTL